MPEQECKRAYGSTSSILEPNGNSEVTQDRDYEFSDIWAELQTERQFVNWGPEGAKKPRSPHWRPQDQLADHPLGRDASISDSRTWASFEVAVEATRHLEWDGIGFVFTSADDYFYIDLDHALDRSGRLQDWVPDLSPFEDCYIEVSPSGNGLHIIGLGHLDVPSHHELETLDETVDGQHREVRLETENRYTTLTGWRWGTAPKDDHHVNLTAWVEAVPDTIARFEVTAGGESWPPSADEYDGDNEIGITAFDLPSLSSYEAGVRSPHPYHGSRTKRNFRVFEDSGGEVAWCYRHGVALTPTHLLAMEYLDYEDCERVQDLTNKEVYEACEKGRNDGLPIPESESDYIDRSYPSGGLAGAATPSTEVDDS